MTEAQQKSETAHAKFTLINEALRRRDRVTISEKRAALEVQSEVLLADFDFSIFEGLQNQLGDKPEWSSSVAPVLKDARDKIVSKLELVSSRKPVEEETD